MQSLHDNRRPAQTPGGVVPDAAPSPRRRRLDPNARAPLVTFRSTYESTMLGLKSGRTARPRGFTYTPRFYDPEAEERRKRQLRFVRPSERRMRTTKQPQFIAVGLALVLAFYLFLNIDTIVERVTTFGGWFFTG